MRIVITGGAGFIGSALIRHIIHHTDHSVLNIDKLTYASNTEALSSVSDSKRYQFEQLDICSRSAMDEQLNHFQPDAIMHLAAESHVDRSISQPSAFMQTNIIGTYTLLEAALAYWQKNQNKRFVFHHVSTDEVFGDLQNDGYFTENSPYQPSSPYSASKASADHLVRAWHRTYGLPVVISNCSNNYGPFQHPEKLIPLVISKALTGETIPVYGDGQQVRDWLYVDDHVSALLDVVANGAVGQTYAIGGNSEYPNLQLVEKICSTLDTLKPGPQPYHLQIQSVDDRPGHDQRYAINADKIKQELSWQPKETLDSGLIKTIQWYIDYLDKQKAG